MNGPRRQCEWCKGPIPVGARADARTCSKACRQAKARFKVKKARAVASAEPKRFAYADPPYPGLSQRYYGREEVDHRELVDRLVAEFPDGWALSTSATALRDVWALCPPDTRLCIWVSRRRSSTLAYEAIHVYEALLVAGGRQRPEPEILDLTDVLIGGGHQRSHPDALTGMKPAAFCEWMFRLLGAVAGDELVDLFPGSGAVGRAWSLYTTGSVPDEDEQLELAS